MRTPAISGGLIVFTLAFAAYVFLAPPVPGDKDTAELAFVLADRGVAHPTGYPLWTLVGANFVRLARLLGAPWPYAANLWSAFLGAAAMAALYVLTVRLVPDAPRARARRTPAPGLSPGLLATLPVLAFVLNPVWTLETTLAEVNAGHVAWVLFAGIVALRAGGEAGVRLGAAASWGLCVGVGLAHHVTSILFVVPLSAALLVQAARSAGPRAAATAAAVGGLAALVPLSAYAWVAYRAANPAAAQWPALEPGLAGAWAHMTGAQYHALLGRFAPSPVQEARLAQYVWPWLVPAIGGALHAVFAGGGPVRRGLAAAVLLQVAYAFLYGVSDPIPYFLPAVAVGLALLVAGLGGRTGRLVPWLAAAVLLVPAIAGVRTALERRAAFERFDGVVRRMWGALPAGPLFVVWDDDMAARLRAMQALEGARQEIEVVQPRQLTYRPARERFRAEHGFDPVAGVTPSMLAGTAADEARSQALVEAIATRINAAGDRPVVLFLPEVPSLRLLSRPDSVATPSSR